MKSIISFVLLSIGFVTFAQAAPFKRGILDGSLDNVQAVKDLHLFDTAINSDGQKSEVSNTNTRADGKQNNGSFQHDKRGVADGSLNNLQAVKNLSVLDSLTNSDPQTSEINNANTRAEGKKNNSAFQHDKRGIADGSLNNLQIAKKISLLNTLTNSDPQESENNNVNTRADGKKNNSVFQHEKRGVADGSLDDLHALDNINVATTNINSDPQYAENNNANTRADGKKNNSIIQHDRRAVFLRRTHRHHHGSSKHSSGMKGKATTETPADVPAPISA
ncbi:uncharacterized protein VTP21DRAFT_11240 [Calcarisporiella thermophila]|uniref:uncharacterized protein n=1 Tax=Calcarisporiella thermophila TaxID=911321 RepID=UPI00374447B6